jgi:signal transduction histidine kinase
LQIQRKDKALLDGLFSGEVISSQGQQYFLTVMIDITERKRAEAEVLRTLAAERELSALKNTFVSMVSHEFRTPLSAILGAAEMLEDFSDRLDPEKRADYFLLIRREIQRLTAMLQDVLLQGQLEAGRVQFQPRPTDVVALCREVVARTQTAFPKHPPVHFETDAPAWRTLADEKLLERVLSNLLSNAFKYSPALTPVHFTIRRAGKEWEIQVRDQGLGISEADQAALFSAFQRGSNVGSIKGAGVGLYVVKKCAEMHGGRMEVHSQAGQGSTFVFAFPWQPAEAAPTATP